MVEIILPMFALVVLTLTVGVSLAVAGVRSVMQRKVHPNYFKIMRGDPPPDHVVRLSRNLINLFETPVLFYAASILVLVLSFEFPTLNWSSFVLLAWAYVICRVVHSLIHTTYNYPVHRGLVFLVSLIILSAMWIKILLVVVDRI